MRRPELRLTKGHRQPSQGVSLGTRPGPYRKQQMTHRWTMFTLAGAPPAADTHSSAGRSIGMGTLRTSVLVSRGTRPPNEGGPTESATSLESRALMEFKEGLGAALFNGP